MSTTSSARAASFPALVVLTAACAMLTGAVAMAGPAAAIEDPRRPVAEVTHGPSCAAAAIRVAVTNGTEEHRVALVFDGTAEQQAAELAAGEQAELAGPDLDWGQTVDVSLTVTDPEGTAEDPIQFGTYTRPSAEDCAAATPTTSPGPAPETTAPETTAPKTTAPKTTAPETPTTSTAPPSSSTGPPSDPTTPSSEPAVPAPPATSAPGVPETSDPVPPAPTSPDLPSTTPAPSSSDVPGTPADDEAGGQPGGATGRQAGATATSVSPGGVLTVRATGFAPGEPVTVSLLGRADPLATVIAADDGSAQAVVQIPRGAALGTATVQLVGGTSSATAGLDLQVAARTRPVVEPTTSAPVLATGVALIGAAGVLGLVAARRSRADRSTTPR